MNMPVDFRLLQAAVQPNSQGITPEQQALYDSLLRQSMTAGTPTGDIGGVKSYVMPEVQARVPTQEELAAAAAIPDASQVAQQMPPETTGLSTPVYTAPQQTPPTGMTVAQAQALSQAIAQRQQAEDAAQRAKSITLPPFFGALAGPGGTRRSVVPPGTVSGTQTPTQAPDQPAATSTRPSAAPAATPSEETQPQVASGIDQGFQGFYQTQYGKPLGSEAAKDTYTIQGKDIVKPRTAMQAVIAPKEQVYGNGTGLQWDSAEGYMKDENSDPVTFDGDAWKVYTEDYPDGLTIKPGSKLYDKFMREQTYRPASVAPDYSTVSYGLPGGQPLTLRYNYTTEGTPVRDAQYFVQMTSDGDVYLQDAKIGEPIGRSLGDYPFKVTKQDIPAKRPAYGSKSAEAWSEGRDAFYQPELEQVYPNVRASLDALRKTGGYGFDENGQITQLSMDESWKRMADMLDPMYLSRLANDQNLQRKVYGAAAGERTQDLAQRYYDFWKNLEDESKGSLQAGQTYTPEQLTSLAITNRVRNAVQSSVQVGGGNVYTTGTDKAQQIANAVAKEIAMDPVSNLGVLGKTAVANALTPSDVKSWFPHYADWYNRNFKDISANDLAQPYGSVQDGKWVGNPYKFKRNLEAAIRNGDSQEVADAMSVVAATLPSGAKPFYGLERRETPTVSAEPTYQLQRQASAQSSVSSGATGGARPTTKPRYMIRDYVSRPAYDSVDSAITSGSSAAERPQYDTNYRNNINIAAAGLSGDFGPQERSRIKSALDGFDDLSRRAQENPELLKASVITNMQKYANALLGDLRLTSKQADSKGNSLLTDTMVKDYIGALKQIYGDYGFTYILAPRFGGQDASSVKNFIQNTEYGIPDIDSSWGITFNKLKESPAVSYLTSTILDYNSDKKDKPLPDDFQKLGIHRMGRIQFLDNVARDLGVGSASLQPIRDISPLMLSGVRSKSVRDEIQAQINSTNKNYRVEAK